MRQTSDSNSSEPHSHLGISALCRLRTISPHEHFGDRGAMQVPLRARKGYLDQFAVIDHPQPEAIIFFIANQNLH